jgi:hypothetical protein
MGVPEKTKTEVVGIPVQVGPVGDTTTPAPPPRLNVMVKQGTHLARDVATGTSHQLSLRLSAPLFLSLARFRVPTRPTRNP